MELFYSPQLTRTSATVELPPEEAHHVRKVYRKQPGEMIELTNGQGLWARGEVETADPRRLACIIREIREMPAPSARNITVALATIRPNRMDWAVEKLSELGVGAIQPLLTEFTSIKTFKTAHLEKIAVSAIKQSRQFYLPRLLTPLTFTAWLQKISAVDGSQRFLAHLQDDAVTFRTHPPAGDRPLTIAIGPEGGFSEEEIEQARATGFRFLKLNDAILRTETAAVSAISQAKLYLG